jgi:hypothetical protein
MQKRAVLNLDFVYGTVKALRNSRQHPRPHLRTYGPDRGAGLLDRQTGRRVALIRTVGTATRENVYLGEGNIQFVSRYLRQRREYSLADLHLTRRYTYALTGQEGNPTVQLRVLSQARIIRTRHYEAPPDSLSGTKLWAAACTAITMR